MCPPDPSVFFQIVTQAQVLTLPFGRFSTRAKRRLLGQALDHRSDQPAAPDIPHPKPFSNGPEGCLSTSGIDGHWTGLAGQGVDTLLERAELRRPTGKAAAPDLPSFLLSRLTFHGS
jgi:hypothetical protein